MGGCLRRGSLSGRSRRGKTSPGTPERFSDCDLTLKIEILRKAQTMRKEIVDKMREGQAAYIAERAAMRQRRLVVGDWLIYRADPMNVVLQKGEDGEQSFYPDAVSAMRVLFRKLTDPKAKMGLADHLRQMERLEREMVEAVTRAGVGDLFAVGTGA